MHSYLVYGLGLRCEFPVPELLEDGGAVTDSAAEVIEVVRGSARPAWVSESHDEDDTDPNALWAERNAEHNEVVLGFGQVGRYWVRAGRHITVEPLPGVEEAVVRHVLLGSVLAHLLWQRDVFTLHASVVGLFGHHVAFVGVSGEGKSTTAASLEAHGHSLVCDDVAAIQQRSERPWVLPGFPRMRLFDEVLRTVGEDPAAHPRVHSLVEKRSKRVSRFAFEPVPLERLFVLATGDAFAIERLSAGAAVMELLRHTFCAHQYAPLYGFKQHLERASRLAAQLPVFRLQRPKDLARLPELVRFVEAHVTD